MKKHNFTLVEVLIVIGIILLLVAITIGGLNRAAARGDEAKTIALMQKMELALEAFYADYGYYPVDTGDVNFGKASGKWNLFMNVTANKRHKSYLEGYGPSDTLLDAYGNAFQYEYPDSSGTTTKYRLWSNGKDETVNTVDDICSWKKH